MRDVICTECNKPTGLKRHYNHLLHKAKQFACKECGSKENDKRKM